ncbi:GntR family transcriptional regulator [Brevibacillus choshinensis]|uniref:GntR family transcriptional regulator n=1 Tax=Brevibacillus choshinensis TaxID=54911 RepID=A0ABR5NDK6_BRECH|nr:GntR family transcriptional regulator [Brevibacillus choshinensis]KQL49645.1 GntR family transcriptional regulator [Brevibacillus choshinensis]
MLNKDDFVPLYIQLQRKLRTQILNGEFKEGEAIPSETEIMKTFQSTRGTVRKAIALLVSEGLVHQVQGKGTFVLLRPLSYTLTNFGGFTDYLKSRKEIAVSKVLEHCRVIVDGKEYYKLVRARGVKKEDRIKYLMIDTSLIPLHLFPGLDQYDFERESLYQVFREKYQIYPKRAEINLSPEKINAQTREILQVDKTEVALLKSEGSIFDQNDVEIEKVKIICGPNVEIKIMTNINGESNFAE